MYDSKHLYLFYILWWGQEIFSSNFPDRSWGRTSLLLSGYRVSFPGVKRSEREVDHSFPSIAEVNNGSSYTAVSLRGQGELYILLHAFKLLLQAPHNEQILVNKIVQHIRMMFVVYS